MGSKLFMGDRWVIPEGGWGGIGIDETHPNVGYGRAITPVGGYQELAVRGELGTQSTTDERKHRFRTHLHMPHHCRVREEVLDWDYLFQFLDQTGDSRAPGHTDGLRFLIRRFTIYRGS
jgi:hypothetical protein